MTRHYLDHASTSPLRPEARHAYVEALDSPAGDPGRIHEEGMAARVALEEAREVVAGFLGARSREVVFTSGATEAVATAVWGAAERGDHVVVPAIEHSSVRRSAEALVEAGTHEVTVVGVDELGRVDPDEVAEALRPTTALVALQWANHEVGTRQPVEAVTSLCRDAGVLTLVDAAQGVGHDPVDAALSGADLVAVSGHKFGGPVGIGVLRVKRGLRLRPLLRGGDQERDRRAGLEDIPSARALAAACEVLSVPGALEAEAAHQRALTERAVAGLTAIEGVDQVGDPHDRVPHVVCFTVEGVEPQAVLMGLDRAGVAAHAGSACASADLLPSPVLEAMGVDAHHSLRISVGWSSTDADVDALLEAAPLVLDRLRALRPTDGR